MTFTFDWAENREKFAFSLERAKNNNNTTNVTVTDEQIMREYVKMGGRILQLDGVGGVKIVDNKSSATDVNTLVKSSVKRNARA